MPGTLRNTVCMRSLIADMVCDRKKMKNNLNILHCNTG